LDKPTGSRLEKFIGDLISKKVEAEQLAESELTFRELEIIKKSFARSLTSFYHTRIEYPKEVTAVAAPHAASPYTVVAPNMANMVAPSMATPHAASPYTVVAPSMAAPSMAAKAVPS
jgi:hypothetical protein